MTLNTEKVRISPAGVAPSLLEGLEWQSSVSEVVGAGFVQGIGHDGIVIGSNPYGDRRLSMCTLRPLRKL